MVFSFLIPYRRSIFLLLLACLTAPAVRAAHISGNMKGAFPGDWIELRAPHYYLDGKADAYKIQLDANLQFTFNVMVPEPQLVFLVYNEDKLPIFLSASDTLMIRADAFKFPLVVQLGGSGAANNRFLFQYLQENQQDFNDFNNLRFKIGAWWAGVEETMNRFMEELGPADYKAMMDQRKLSSFAMLDDFSAMNSGALSADFSEWISNEIIYSWAYHLIVYGHVYAGRHQIQAEFFDFLFEAPTISAMIGSDWYRQFLLALMARQQAKSGQTDQFWAGQYYLAGNLLDGKPLAFFRSEMINIAFSVERYQEILPLFNDFMKTNRIPGYDEKVADLYHKFSRVSPGTLAPEFSGKSENGAGISLSQLRGKVVYLNFWASWCGSCIRKMEMFNDFADELQARGVEIINISIDQDRSKWQNALLERTFRGKQLLSADSSPNPATLYQVEAVPQYFILNKDGTFADKAASANPNDIRLRLLDLAKRQ